MFMSLEEKKKRGERFRKGNKNLLIKHNLKDWEEIDWLQNVNSSYLLVTWVAGIWVSFISFVILSSILQLYFPYDLCNQKEIKEKKTINARDFLRQLFAKS